MPRRPLSSSIRGTPPSTTFWSPYTRLSPRANLNGKPPGDKCWQRAQGAQAGDRQGPADLNLCRAPRRGDRDVFPPERTGWPSSVGLGRRRASMPVPTSGCGGLAVLVLLPHGRSAQAARWPRWQRRQPKHGAHGCERSPMDRRGTEQLERSQVLPYGIALVPGKTVTRVHGVEPVHDSIARGLGKDRSGGNRHAASVTLNDGTLGYLELLEPPRIEQDVLGGHAEALERATHGELTGPIDINGVDLLHFGKADRPGRGRCLYL